MSLLSETPDALRTDPEPVTYRLDRGDVAYIVDALLDAADARRGRPGRNLAERLRFREVAA